MNKLFDKRQMILIASIAILTFIVLLIINKCSTSKQADQNTISAVAQNIIDAKNSNIAILQKQNLSIRQAQDSLLLINSGLNEQIHQKDVKIAYIASNAAKEKNRVKELPADSAAILFLARANCSELIVLKYDAKYIMPIEPIRFYNLMAVDFDELKALHQNLSEQYGIRILQVNNLNKVIDSKDQEAENLNTIINDKDGIIIQKDKQIVSEHKKLKQQKIKTYLVGTAGVILCVVGIIL